MRRPARARRTPATLTSTLAAAPLDHVVIAVAELAAVTCALAARHGVALVAGRPHDGDGTADRIVPLGESTWSWSPSSTRRRAQ
jgi:hypothetical protein